MKRCFSLTLFIFYICQILSLGSKAQDIKGYKVSYIDVSEGLSNNYVRNVIRDDYGFKWIATEGGLNKYDGKTFQVFKPSNTPELANENIEVVFKDKSGDLWIGTKSGGLSFFDARKEQFHNFNKQVFGDQIGENVRVTTIAEGRDGRIFVGTWDSGLYVFRPDEDEPSKRYLHRSKIEKLHADEFGNVWISESVHLIKYNPSEDRLLRVGSFGSIGSMKHDVKRNVIWLGIQGKGLGFLDLEDHSYHSSQLALDKMSIQSITLDRWGKVYIGTWGTGLFISDISAMSFEKFSMVPSVFDVNNTSYESILDVHLDINDIIWLSTAFGGIVKLMPVNNFRGVEQFLSNKQLPDNNIYALKADSKNNVWFGTYGGGITIWKDNELKKLSNLKLTKVNTFLEIDDKMLIGGREGLLIADIDAPNQEFRRMLDRSIKVTALHLTRDNKLWIGTQQKGLFFIDDFNPRKGKAHLQNAFNWVGGDRISAFTEDSQGNLWIGTFSGLYVYNKASDDFIAGSTLLQQDLPSSIINDLYLDTKMGKLWIALSGGLVEVDVDGITVNRIKINGTDKGLKNEFVTSVIKDNADNIWVGTALGIAKYVPERDVFENYGEFEGVPVNSFNSKSVTKTAQGSLFFGSTNGLTYFNPQDITYYQADPEVLFTSFRINGKTVNVGEQINGNVVLETSLTSTSDIKLSYKDEAFSFTLSPLDYYGDDNVLFSYRLVGFDNDWSAPSANGEIRFTNLDPKSYRLEVRASRDSFHWSEIAAKNIIVGSPPWATWYAYALYVMIVLGLAYLINYITKRQLFLKANLKIERIAREKEHDLSEAKIKFFTNISHEFRSPLTLILTPVTELLLDENIKGKVRERLTTVDRSASRLLELINQLLDFRKSENGLLQLRVAKGDFVTFAREVFLSFKIQAESKKIKFIINSDMKSMVLPFDRDKMEIVLVNLLSNAFKYTAKEGEVTVNISESNGKCDIRIIDNGKGIEPSEIDRVFDRFYQISTTDSAKLVGSGIGLSLTKNIIDLHHGEIHVESEPNVKTEFIVQLPIVNEKLSEQEYIPDFKDSDAQFTSVNQDDQGKESKVKVSMAATEEESEKILVVDDNLEIRKYLISLLSEENYKIISAENGMEALQMANDEHPDLIISDVMMPEMDGITLTSTIKNDMNTSHIPVILLTARTSTVFEVSGLETGADDYIKKPFHPTVIKMRVNSLLDNRRKLREHFRNKLRFEPGEQVQAPGIEEKFIQSAIAYIEEHIHDSEFGIETLMDSMAMSKSTLYRKLKSLTGLSITGFIRSVKLKKAAGLILTEDWKLNQVAYESGFNDYKYFKTCFQEQFDCLPSEYKTRKAQLKED